MFDNNIKIILKNNDYIIAKYIDLIKINYFQQLFEDRNYNEINEIKIDKIDKNNFKLILDFTKIDTNEIFDYIYSIKQVSEKNTLNMPIILKKYLEIFSITHDKYKDMKIINNIIKFKNDCNFLQYDLLCDIIEYKWADNYRIMDKKILKEILTENIINNINYYNDVININELDDKIIEILFDYYNIDEDIIEYYFKNKNSKEDIYNILKIQEIKKDKLKEILLNNVDNIIEELKFI